METRIIYPENVYPHHECFMSFWKCPRCSNINTSILLQHEADYMCEACIKISQYIDTEWKPRPKRCKKYYYVLTRNY